MPTDVNTERWKCLPFIDMLSLWCIPNSSRARPSSQRGEVLLGCDAKAQTVKGEKREKPTLNTNFYFYPLAMSGRGIIT